jgi:drug/metabolite transporter (DMT)-like permease
MATQLWAIGFVVAATFIGAFGPIFLKKATCKLNREALASVFGLLRATLGNVNLVLGIGLYALGLILYLFGLRGADLSVLYPLNSLSYVWVSTFSVVMLREKMTFQKWSGVALIIIGALLVGLGS